MHNTIKQGVYIRFFQRAIKILTEAMEPIYVQKIVNFGQVEWLAIGDVDIFGQDDSGFLWT